MAEAVLCEHLKKAGLDGKVVVDSAGTGDWHVGGRMEARARTQLTRNGYDGESHRARQFQSSWLQERDLILAMDTTNLRDLRALAASACQTFDGRNRHPIGCPPHDRLPGGRPPAPPEDQSRIRLFGEIADLDGQDVPDPYYGSAADFARVLALLEEGMSHLVLRLAAIPELPAECL
jgi:low molecular weight protein-tyrosine phosphatase